MKKFILLLCFFSHLSAKDTFTPISDPNKLPKSHLNFGKDMMPGLKIWR